MRRKLSQRYWLDDSLGCCLLMWYCPFNFQFNFQFYFRNLKIIDDRLGLKTEVRWLMAEVSSCPLPLDSRLQTSLNSKR